jgi:Zinc-binding loop region of homing endonuclease
MYPPKTARICAICHTTFWRAPSIFEVHKGSGTYCSVACKHTADRLIYRQNFWQKVLRCQHMPWCIYCCWIWKSKKLPNGYGVLTVHGKQRYAHRISWEIYNQRFLPRHTHTYVVQHLCHNKLCVNPWHLSFDTQSINLLASARNDRLGTLTLEDVKSIRVLLADGLSCKRIAKQFHVSESAIEHIKYKRTWRHVP